MMVLVSYDVSTKTPSGTNRLRKIAERCVDSGMRVQDSVFECEIDPDQWELLKHDLLSLYKAEEDSLRFYFLGSNWQNRIEHYGTKDVPDVRSDAMIL